MMKSGNEAGISPAVGEWSTVAMSLNSFEAYDWHFPQKYVLVCIK